MKRGTCYRALTMKVTVDFNANEYDELRELAERERRDLRDQVVVLVLQALRDRQRSSEPNALPAAAPARGNGRQNHIRGGQELS